MKKKMIFVLALFIASVSLVYSQMKSYHVIKLTIKDVDFHKTNFASEVKVFTIQPSVVSGGLIVQVIFNNDNYSTWGLMDPVKIDGLSTFYKVNSVDGIIPQTPVVAILSLFSTGGGVLRFYEGNYFPNTRFTDSDSSILISFTGR